MSVKYGYQYVIYITLSYGNLKLDKNSQARERGNNGTGNHDENVDENDEQGYHIL